MWAGLIELLLPSRCAGCGGPGAAFCATCRDQTVLIRPPLCDRCGAPEPGVPEPGAPELVAPEPGAPGPGRVTTPALLASCATCRRAPPPIEVARSLAVYAGPLRRAICALKFRRRKAVAGALGGLLADLAPSEVTRDVGTVVPVPLHPDRLRVRGFNQAELLARRVAARLGVPCEIRALRRIHQVHPQVELRRGDRQDNVRGAFAPGDVAVSGTVLLVDDVYATGATAAACARALRQAGATRVAVLTLARAVRQGGPCNSFLHAPMDGSDRGQGALRSDGRESWRRGR